MAILNERRFLEVPHFQAGSLLPLNLLRFLAYINNLEVVQSAWCKGVWIFFFFLMLENICALIISIPLLSQFFTSKPGPSSELHFMFAISLSLDYLIHHSEILAQISGMPSQKVIKGPQASTSVSLHIGSPLPRIYHHHCLSPSFIHYQPQDLLQFPWICIHFRLSHVCCCHSQPLPCHSSHCCSVAYRVPYACLQAGCPLSSCPPISICPVHPPHYFWGHVVHLGYDHFCRPARRCQWTGGQWSR